MIFKLRLEEIAGLALLAIVVALQLAACGRSSEMGSDRRKTYLANRFDKDELQ
ncbi:MAG: hypothetical protein LAP85_07340 [Acidobacteriia bacterium]|nr:hypothetical protein [Terriglobia bacterium]